MALEPSPSMASESIWDGARAGAPARAVKNAAVRPPPTGDGAAGTDTVSGGPATGNTGAGAAGSKSLMRVLPKPTPGFTFAAIAVAASRDPAPLFVGGILNNSYP